MPPGNKKWKTLSSIVYSGRAYGSDIPEFLHFSEMELYFLTYPFREVLCRYNKYKFPSSLSLGFATLGPFPDLAGFAPITFPFSVAIEKSEACVGIFPLIWDLIFLPSFPRKSLLCLSRDFVRLWLSINGTMTMLSGTQCRCKSSFLSGMFYLYFEISILFHLFWFSSLETSTLHILNLLCLSY